MTAVPTPFPTTPPAPLDSRGPAPYRFTVDQYYRMAEVGVLPANARVELIDGRILDMSPVSPEHAAAVRRIRLMLSQRFEPTYLILCQDPVRLEEYDEPEPDLAVLRPRPDGYAHAHPGPDDILLLIEVAVTSRDFDRGDKAQSYAAAGIADYWVVDLPGAGVDVFRNPNPEGYRKPQRMADTTPIVPLAFPEWSVTPQELLGTVV